MLQCSFNPFLTKLKTILAQKSSATKESLISSRAMKNNNDANLSQLPMEDDELERQTFGLNNHIEQSSGEKSVNGESVTVCTGIAILDDSNAQMIPEKDSNYEEETAKSKTE